MSGLAGKVLRAADSDEFDLANYDQGKCDDLVKNAFSQPLPIANMIKLSFVVGGGKLVRQKYTDDLPKVFMCSLTAGGYKEDNSACLEDKQGGKFKFQHDTGKNLKFVHVFPHVKPPVQADGADAGDDEEEEEAVPQTPEEILLTCEMDDFKQLISRQLETYGQKKRLQDLLKSRITQLEEIEAKMTNLEKLSAEEQALFDGVGAEELKEKVKAVSVVLQGMVDAGQLTSAEKSELLEQLETRLGAVEADLAKAEAEGKQKKVQALQAGLEAVRTARNKVKDCSPVSLPPMKHAQNIKKYYSKLAELAKLEKNSKGNYTLAELTKLGEKPEIEEAIAELEQRSRGWLEGDDVFQERRQACKAGAGGAKKAPGPPAGGAGYSSGSGTRPSAGASGSGFSTVSRGRGSGAGKAKAKAPATRNAFAAFDD